MKKYVIPVSSGKAGSLVEESTGLCGPELEQLFFQGSVWRGSRRLRDSGEILRPEPGQPGELTVFQPEKPIVPFDLDPGAVVFEDDDLLIVYKPPNLNTVQTAMSDLDNLTRGVQLHLDRKRSAGSESYQVNAVHRLDMPAQGLVHYGKHKEAEKKLFGLFQNRRIRKVYWAQIPRPSGSEPGRVLYIRDTLDWMGKEKKACSWMKCLRVEGSGELWAASPLTGRPHQLRKHFARYLQPLMGDVMYGPYQIPAELRLASVYSRFTHPFTGKTAEIFRAPSGWGLSEEGPFPACLPL